MRFHLCVLLAVVLAAVSDAFKLTSSLSPLRSSGRRTTRTFSLSMGGKYKVGIVGATGAVGEEILKVMENRKFPASSVKLFASEKSAGKSIDSSEFGKLTLEAYTFDSASECDVCLLAVDGDFSKVPLSFTH